MASYLVTGSSRGIGLALAATLASQPASEVAKVFAAARSASEGLKKVISELGGDRIEYVELEVTSVESIQRAVAQVSVSLGGTAGLDVLINNAANIGSHEDRDVLD
ncbi:Short-chain dehydrogenase/reductase SDR, partial [Macrophomina phaseolina MS6]